MGDKGKWLPRMGSEPPGASAAGGAVLPKQPRGKRRRGTSGAELWLKLARRFSALLAFLVPGICNYILPSAASSVSAH